MPIQPAPPSPTAGSGQEAETVLVEHYGRLVRIAYLVLPPRTGGHGRVLAAHRVVQRSLPRAGAGDDGYTGIRARVLDAALRADRRRLPRAALPLVLGLRLAPSVGGADGLSAARALAGLPAPARAALALSVVDRLPDQEITAALAGAGVTDPAAALRAAAGVRQTLDGAAESVLRTAEFDPGRVLLHPTDLLRRRTRRRIATASAATLLAVTAVLVTGAYGGGTERRGASGPPGVAAVAAALDPAGLRSAPAERWADTARVDFSVWPARGERRADRALLGRALRAWGGEDSAVRVTPSAGTGSEPPAAPPSLLFAGDVDGAAVVLLHDGLRVARYAEPLNGGGSAVLDLARTDRADVTTAAAVVVSRTPDGTRYLLAPWIAEAGTRDLLRPTDPTRRLAAPGGLTPRLATPAAGGCAAWPVLSLRSSARIVEQHSFLLTDLGELTPVHLTHTPAPGAGAPARQPREATGPSGLAAWARTACTLGGLRGQGVRAVNDWAYARQPLPERAGTATWVCTRADTWAGAGHVTVWFQPPGTGPGSPGTAAAGARDTAACSRFGQHVVAGTKWRAPDGTWWVVAAGSRATARLSVAGGGADGPTAAVRVSRATPVKVTAFHADGSPFTPPGAPTD